MLSTPGNIVTQRRRAKRLGRSNNFVASMSEVLHDIFARQGLNQYLEPLRDEGFDSWDTVLDVTETDLDALGMKLGHRRKLQRQIAFARGVPPSAALPTPSQQDQGPKVDSGKPSKYLDEGAGDTVRTKRRYRRHPKSDKNAPIKPRSAYVLFSNKTREELEGQGFSFTEVSKIIGEKWQHLFPEKKRQLETRAQQAKEKYRRDLSEYKKTPEHRQYSQYLQDFKNRHQPIRKDASKVPASGVGRSHRGSTSSARVTSPRSNVDRTDGTGRNSFLQGAEPVSLTGRQGMANFIDAPFRNSAILAQTGPYQHWKLPSLSDVLDDGAGGRYSINSDRNSLGNHTPPRRLALPYE